jgi:hypothetical protein
MFKKVSPPFLAFLQASSVVLYVVLLSTSLTLVTPHFTSFNAQFFAPVVMLLLFIVSAVISGLLVLGRAGYLFWEKKYKESFSLVGLTVGWIIVYSGIFITTLYFMK